MEKAVQEYVPGLPAAPGAADRRAVAGHAGPAEGEHLRRGGGRRRLPAAVRRQPRHHDRRRRAACGENIAQEPRDERAAPLDPETCDDTLDPHLVRRPRPPADRHLPARRVAPQAAPVHRAGGARHRRGARRLRRAGDRGDPRRRPGRLVVQLRLLAHARAGADQDRGGDREARQDRVPDAARASAPRTTSAPPRTTAARSAGSPPTAPRPTSRVQHFGLRPRARSGDGRLPDDEPHPAAGGAGQAGADHGRRRLPVRVRRRLGRRADHGADRRPGLRARRRDRRRGRRSGSTATRTSASASPTRSSRPAAGATQIDGSVRRFGAGAGNTPLEAFVGVCDKLGWRTGVDFLKIIDASEDVVRPAMPEECQLDRMTLMMGYAGVYSSFLKHAGNAAERYGVSGAQDPARGRPAQADRRPGGPAHRHRADAQGRGRQEEAANA